MHIFLWKKDIMCLFMPVSAKQREQECAFLCLNIEIWNHEKSPSSLLLFMSFPPFFFFALFCLFTLSHSPLDLTSDIRERLILCRLWITCQVFARLRGICFFSEYLSEHFLTITRIQTGTCLPQVSEVFLLLLNIFSSFFKEAQYEQKC